VNKVITEAIGTFFLVFAVVGAVSQGSPLAAFAIGGTLAVAIYAGGHIAGASLASLLGAWVFRTTMAHSTAWSGRALVTAIIVEVLFTFFLAFVVLNVATSKDHPDNSFYGAAIGGVVLVGILLVGPLSGAAFNPAVALGVTFANLSAWGNLWAYVVAQVVGGLLAGVAFRALNPEDK